MASGLIELEGVHLAFGQEQVFRGLDLEVQVGDSLTLMGPSGCGKSLCLKMMVGLVEPDAGVVRFAGRSLEDMDSAELAQLRRRMTLVFQRDALFDSLTILENVEFGLVEHTHMPAEQRRQRVIECLDMVDLGPDTLDLRPAEISGGMKKRVALARAVAFSPEILLFDEPFEGLDPRSVNRVRDMIERIAQVAKSTTIIATHHMPAAFSFSERFVLIQDGVVVLDGDSDAFRSSEDPTVHAFVYGPAPDGDGEMFRGDM